MVLVHEIVTGIVDAGVNEYVNVSEIANDVVVTMCRCDVNDANANWRQMTVVVVELRRSDRCCRQCTEEDREEGHRNRHWNSTIGLVSFLLLHHC